MIDYNTDRLNELRAKARTHSLAKEELKEAILLMRQGRVSAAIVSTKSRTKKTAAAEKEVMTDAKVASLLDNLFADPQE